MRRRQRRAAGRAGLAGCLVAVAAACAAGGGARAAAPSTTGRSRGTTVATTEVEPTTSTVPVVPSTTVAPTTVAPTAAPGTTTPAVPVSPLVAGGAGRVVVLDPGHDGGNASHPAEINRQVPAGGFTKACDTTGTQTDGGYPEHAFTFDVALRVATLLRGQGLTVVLTRPDDAGVGPVRRRARRHRQPGRGRRGGQHPRRRRARRRSGLPRARARRGIRARWPPSWRRRPGWGSTCATPSGRARRCRRRPTPGPAA